MKKLLFIALVFCACKKSGTSNVVDIYVKENPNGQPVQGATISLRRCASLGCFFGTVEEFNGQTDNNGVCHVPVDKYNKVPDWNEAVYVTKKNYYSSLSSKSASIIINSYGWMRVRIIRTSNYPQGATLKISVWNGVQPPYLNLQEFNLAADSSILLTGFGNQLNKIDWQVSDNTGLLNYGTWNQQVPRLDTVKNITLNY